MKRNIIQLGLLIGGVIIVILLLYSIGLNKHVGLGVEQIHQRVRDAGGQIGDPTISLAWDNYNDLDLHVVCPHGDEIFFRNRRSNCSGELDVDKNAGRPETMEPVENIRWLNNPPEGTYKVYVVYYADHNCSEGCEREVPYTVVITQGGESEVFEGEVTRVKERDFVTEFYFEGQEL